MTMALEVRLDVAATLRSGSTALTVMRRKSMKMRLPKKVLAFGSRNG